MSARLSPLLGATALQASAVLARYEQHVRQLASSWLDMELYEVVSSELDEIKVYTASLPRIAVPWAALLTSHAELIHALWSSEQAGGRDGRSQVELHLQEHLDCIDSLARRCRQIAAGAEWAGANVRT